MVFRSKNYFASLKHAVSLLPFVLSSCAQTNLTPVRPSYPFKIERYYAFMDEQPGTYDLITINDYTYCYYSKKMEDDDELVIFDKDCDLHSDRVVVLSGNKVMVAADTKYLKPEQVQNLDYILRNHIKNIVPDTTIF